MKLNDEFFDEYEEFKGYEIVLYRRDKCIPAVFNLTEEEFEENKQLVILLDFLIKTDQWVPYAIYQDLFKLPEENYPGLRLIDEMQLRYIEQTWKVKNINIY